MPTDLSRNLYRLDEVQSAAIYCLLCARGRDAAFWLAELLVSDRAVEAIYCMVYAWLVGIGPLRLEWYRRAWEVFRREEIHDGTVLQYGIALASSIASRPSGEREWKLTRDSTTVLLLLDSASRQGLQEKEGKSIRSGWRTLAEKSESNAWNHLHSLAKVDARLHQTLAALEDIKSVVGDELGERLKRLAVSCGYLSTVLPAPLQQESWRPLLLRPLESEYSQWLEGGTGVRRSRRVIEIPYLCLYGMTERGNLSQKEDTVSELRYSLEDTLRKSSWWADKLPKKEDDIEMEQFYEVWFPEDIPDEWSLEDQKKSHGSGARMGEGPTTFQKLSIRWFPRDRSAWFSPSCSESIWRGAIHTLGDTGCFKALE